MNRWILDHSQAMKDAWKRTSCRLTPFVVLVLLLGILLALPGWLAQIWLGMATLIPEEAVQSEAIVFLQKDLDVETRIDLERTLTEMEEADQVVFVPKSAALDALSAEDGLAPIADLKSNNPLPDALRLTFTITAGEAKESQIVQMLESDDRVLSLRYYPSTRIQYASLVEMLGFLGIGLSALTIIGVLMAVFLVSAADVVDDHRRIELYTLLGASHRFIRRPYLYRATLLGVLAGLSACLVIVILNEVLSSALASNLKALDDRLENIPMDGRILFGVASIAVLASWVGAERAVSRRLKVLH
ncbi:permease-like cell division protein FtsX [Litoricola sp.]|nr:permease-like cell division protein FtsX [Litorivicinus sp.]